MTARSEALAYYEAQIVLALDRIRLFETGAMSTGDLGPPHRDTTAESIEVERALIRNYQRGIDILRRADA
jgi:hypothetical protein